MHLGSWNLRIKVLIVLINLFSYVKHLFSVSQM